MSPLAEPFQMVVLGVDMTDDEQMVAVCVQWVDAYRRWARGT